MNGFELPSKNWLGVVLIATFSLAGGCNPTTVNTLQGIRAGNGTGIQVGTEKLFVLEGQGTCTSVTVNWGDGMIETNFIPVPGRRIELETSAIETRYLKHTYTGWGGGKTVTVDGNGCEGKVRGRFQADPRRKFIGWKGRAPAGTTGVCQTVAGLPSMIPRMLVQVSVTNVAGRSGVGFGCPGCIYDADGRVGSPAPPSFPFVGLTAYSVVFRVGSQVVQGGSFTQFTTTSSGALEFCLNDGDNDLTNNSGEFEVEISVDELGPPPP
jgi:hypothetical protein